MFQANQAESQEVAQDPVKQQLADLFYKRLNKICGFELTENDRMSMLYQWLNRIFYEFTKDENLQFTTAYARIAFACHKFKFDPDLQWRIQYFRKLAQRSYYDEKGHKPEEFAAGIRVVAECVQTFLPSVIPDSVKALFPAARVYIRVPVEIVAHKACARVVILDNDKPKQQFIGRDQDHETEEVIRIKYNQTGVNDLFHSTVKHIDQIWKNKVTVNLLDVSIEKDGTYIPTTIIIEPDYLLDVTAISECFQSFGTESLLYLLKKFLPVSSSVPLMIGNIANFFLDELMQDDKANFMDVFPKSFNLNPVAFCTFPDMQVREIMHKGKSHFRNLRRVVSNEFHEQGIDPEHCYLEPSFYSDKYGIQGRLDVLYNEEEKDEFAIVELKSGSPYGANKFGLSRNHYTQTLLYDLLVKSVYGEDKDTAKYILYSKLGDQNLKYAPSLEIQQQEALATRNELVAIEQQLIAMNRRNLLQPCILDKISPKYLPRLSGFVRRDAFLFSEVLRKITPIARKYFLTYTSFIALEHRLAKTGAQGVDKMNGLAALWLNHYKDKRDNFDIISHLVVVENLTKEDNPVLKFAKTPETHQLANFRKGDIAVLYPAKSTNDTVLTNQIFKCSIIDIDDKFVNVRLRSKQFNDSLFRSDVFWNLEHDLIDSSFNSLYRSLFAFLQYPPGKKELLLAQRAPRKVEPKEIKLNTGLSEEQKTIIQKAIAAKEYFLLVGPPGTGKTKFMLANLVRHLLENSEENIMLLAYTNRAVDEICEAIDSFASNDFVRIGSRYATGEAYQNRLFSYKTLGVTSRAELTDIIKKHRIFVSTVSSMVGRHDLFKLKKFDRVIIDEASQILEPMLMGLLPRFERFILIGDHKQLPAVVMQNKRESAVQDEDLIELGLTNRRNSLFERLFIKCQQNNWNWAYDMLTHQGRMHQDISSFPNKFFYEGKLKSLPDYCQEGMWQEQPLQLRAAIGANSLEQRLAKERLIYLPTPIDETTVSNKTNVHEAKLIGRLVDSFAKLYAENGKEFTAASIGVITPYRAQIAQIRSVLEECDKAYKAISVDTVERYQGGAREVILISLCLNSRFQLEGLVSLSDDGKVDRKLNVALTRARQQLVILGNEEIMHLHPIYKALVEHCGTMNDNY